MSHLFFQLSNRAVSPINDFSSSSTIMIFTFHPLHHIFGMVILMEVPCFPPNVLPACSCPHNKASAWLIHLITAWWMACSHSPKLPLSPPDIPCPLSVMEKSWSCFHLYGKSWCENPPCGDIKVLIHMNDCIFNQGLEYHLWIWQSRLLPHNQQWHIQSYPWKRIFWRNRYFFRYSISSFLFQQRHCFNFIWIPDGLGKLLQHFTDFIFPRSLLPANGWNPGCCEMKWGLPGPQAPWFPHPLLSFSLTQLNLVHLVINLVPSHHLIKLVGYDG